ncbi:MAG: hypothetical protein HC881_21340 [Leptolyngbyaceae cyanobacterium SL_7_1]|nr:hypothetical protein [Leptolyngbyaceae cyanobacterium SL_7_1]
MALFLLMLGLVMLQLSRRTSEEVYQLALGISGLVLLIWGFIIAHSLVQVAIEILLLVLYRFYVARLAKKSRALAMANIDY